MKPTKGLKVPAKGTVLWPGINQYIENVVKACPICQEHSHKPPAEPLLQHELPTRPWQILGRDICTLNCKDYLLTADNYFKLAFVRTVPPINSIASSQNKEYQKVTMAPSSAVNNSKSSPHLGM